MGAMRGMHKACQFVNVRLISAELLGGFGLTHHSANFSYSPEIPIT